MSYEFTDQYARSNNDFYAEPRWCNNELFKTIRFKGAIHDPACGSGRIVESAKTAGYITSANDKVARPYSYQEQAINFLEDQTIYENIVCNPPYNIDELFFHHARQHTKYSVAFLTRLAFLESQSRYKTIFKPFPPEQILVFSTRPSMPPYGKPVGGGKTAYCWIIWNMESPQLCTKVNWILHK